jgi:DNA phosphorothioation-dependent restriction protein DptH
MTRTELHGQLLSQAVKKVLGTADRGTMAFIRCLTPGVIECLARDTGFAPGGWSVWRVADVPNPAIRTITADEAVELREGKGDATLLLVDTARSGAGMDGIYSAAQEVDEEKLFDEARRLAASAITKSLSSQARRYVERAIKQARGFGQRISLSPWTEFDFLVRIAAEKRHPGELLYLLGLWPVQQGDLGDPNTTLDVSRLFVDHLLSTSVAGLTPAQRITTLNLLNPSAEQVTTLERFLRTAATKPLLLAMEELGDARQLWVNVLQIESAAKVIQSIELIPWRTKSDRIAKWSGLIESGASDEPPMFILKADANKTGDYSRLVLRWKARPANLAEGAVVYRVAIVTDMDEELAYREVPHSSKREGRCYFSNEDFSLLSDDALVAAKAVISVIGNDDIESLETEEFTVRFGQPPDRMPGGVGKKVRTFSEGVIELQNREAVTDLAASLATASAESKGFVLLRTPERGKSFRVFRPPLVQEVENDWVNRSGAIGRWRVKVRASGARATPIEFVPFEYPDLTSNASWRSEWDRAARANKLMAERFARSCGGIGQIYDERAKGFESVKEYILAWAALLEGGDPALALAHTVEIQSLSGKTIGLIVMPAHPVRVAWHVAYDNLVLHSAFDEGAPAKDIRKEFILLDGAMFPAFLPGLPDSDPIASFVFADTLGFHVVGMVPDDDKEPKASVALLARALGESQGADNAPTVGKQSAQILGNELIKYLACHDTARVLTVHALRPGDALTMARSLGRVQEYYQQSNNEESEEADGQTAPAFVLELYPSYDQRGVAGRFIAEAREKKRTGAGMLAREDRWMLESLNLSGEMSLPKLRWARKTDEEPKTPAHIAVAFDTFESRVKPERVTPRPRPLFAYGLLSFFDRQYASQPAPVWRSAVYTSLEGEKHPSDRTHSERLSRLQGSIANCVVQNHGASDLLPVLQTEISPEKAHALHELHRLCDWVITLDRNAGIEYFDSPRDNRDIYDAYVIDCVPEREDLGCLQLITSTSNLEEVRILLDGALNQMGLSHSRRNAKFLMEHLKALSGRLAIRLTGQKAPTSELIALALTHANCSHTTDDDSCWMPLRLGFVIPVDDVLDLIPPLSEIDSEQEQPQGSLSLRSARPDLIDMLDLIPPLSGIDREQQPQGSLSARSARPDLIYVSLVPRKGLCLQFIEVKYRRHLREARSPEVLETVRHQVESLRERWERWYSTSGVSAFRALRRAKLARILRFYADKARRHYLEEDRYQAFVTEINRIIEKGEEYSFAVADRGDRGWLFCPEYSGSVPLEMTPLGWDIRIFLFGPALLPDSDSGREGGRGATVLKPNEGTAATDLLASPYEGVVVGTTESVDSVATSSVATAVTTEATGREKGSDEAGGADSIRENLPEDGVRKLSDSGQAVCLGMDLLNGSEVCWDITIRGNPHLLIAGLPGMGKTTCLLNLCKQMLAGGIRPIVFSYHQDIDERLATLVPNVRFLDFHGLGFNPLRVMDRESPMAYLDVAGAMRDIFVAIYPELGDIQGERIRKAVKDSFLKSGWADPEADLATLTEPLFGRFVEILRSEPKPDRGLRALLARLEELADYGFFDPSEHPQSLWDTEQPTVIRIHTTQNDNLQKAFASLVFYGLYKDMFRRGIQQRITHAVVFDEAHRAARLQLIPTMAKECRKYGISLVLASQEARDFNVSLFSAIANYLVLRLNEADAKALVRNVASSDQERALVDKIKQMDRFKAFYFSEGRKKPSLLALEP